MGVEKSDMGKLEIHKFNDIAKGEKKMKICKKCIMLDTRPRLKFNNQNVCSACEWDEIKKKQIDWAS